MTNYIVGDRCTPINLYLLHFIFISFLSHQLNVIGIKCTSFGYIPTPMGAPPTSTLRKGSGVFKIVRCDEFPETFFPKGECKSNRYVFHV